MYWRNVRPRAFEGASLTTLRTHYDRHFLLAFWSHEVTTTFRASELISGRNIRCNYGAWLTQNPVPRKLFSPVAARPSRFTWPCSRLIGNLKSTWTVSA